MENVRVSAGEFENETDSDGRGRKTDGRCVADDDPSFVGGRHVEHLVSRAGRDDELEFRQLFDHLARKGRAFAGEDDHGTALERPDDVVGATQRPVEHGKLDFVVKDRPIRHLERGILVVVENGTAVFFGRHGKTGRIGVWSLPLQNAKPALTQWGGAKRKLETTHPFAEASPV